VSACSCCGGSGRIWFPPDSVAVDELPPGALAFMDNYNLVPVDDFGKVEVLLDPEVMTAIIIAFEAVCPACGGVGLVKKSSQTR
jgi:hypothetical protein